MNFLCMFCICHLKFKSTHLKLHIETKNNQINFKKRCVWCPHCFFLEFSLSAASRAPMF